MGILEVLDSSTHGGLKLNDGSAIVGDLVVHDDIELETLGLHDALDSAQIKPDVVRVENLELADCRRHKLRSDEDVHGIRTRLEVLHVLPGHLCNLEQTDATLVVDESTTLNIRLGLVGDLHDVL